MKQNNEKTCINFNGRVTIVLGFVSVLYLLLLCCYLLTGLTISDSDFYIKFVATIFVILLFCIFGLIWIFEGFKQ